MQIQKNLFLALTIIACLSSIGCEDKRYKPAAWRSTTLPAADATEAKTATEKAAATDSGQTDWLEMAGKGGENVRPRGSSLPAPVAGGSTLPSRSNRTMRLTQEQACPHAAAVDRRSQREDSDTKTARRCRGAATAQQAALCRVAIMALWAVLCPNALTAIIVRQAVPCRAANGTRRRVGWLKTSDNQF